MNNTTAALATSLATAHMVLSALLAEAEDEVTRETEFMGSSFDFAVARRNDLRAALAEVEAFDA